MVTRKTDSKFKQVDPAVHFAQLQSNGLTFEDQIIIEEDFLQQGLEYWLKKFRTEHSITQIQLAKELGVSQSAVCQMLKNPSRIATLSRLITAMGGIIDVTITFNGQTTSLLFGTTNEQAMTMIEEDRNTP